MLSAVSQPTTEEGVYRSLPPAHRLLRRILDRLLEYDPFLYLLFTLLPAASEDDAPRAFVAALLMNDRHTDGYRNDMRQFADLPAYPVQDIAVPTVIVHGTRDVDIPFAQAERLARTIPRARLVPIDGANHASALLTAEAVAAIRTFLRETTPRAGARQ